MLRAIFSRLARRWFPPKVVAERIVPWIQVAATLVGGAWALVQYTSSVADRKAEETVKLLSVYTSESDTKDSLKARYNKLWDAAHTAVFSDPQLAELLKTPPKTEAEKAAIRLKIQEGMRAFAKAPSRYEKYSRIYSYFNMVVACAAEGRCDRAIVNSTLGIDLLSFLNGACGFFAETDQKWRTNRTGQAIYDYVVSQRLESLSEAETVTPFLCEKFRSQYRPPNIFDRLAFAIWG